MGELEIPGIGKQDVDITQITPRIHLPLTSDHLVMDARDTGLEAGSEVTFDVEYGALLRIMTSSYVEKVFLHP